VTLTSAQERRLVWSTKKWARMLDTSASSLSKDPDRFDKLAREYDFSNLTRDQLREVRSAVYELSIDAHMIAICLRQIDEHAQQLKRSSLWSRAIARAGETFSKIMRSEELIDLRDVMEHSAHYVVGDGKKPALVLDPDQDWPSVLGLNGKVARISVFGRSYEVQEAIRASIAFVKTLPPTDKLA
jgi:hypothetical protein